MKYIVCILLFLLFFKTKAENFNTQEQNEIDSLKTVLSKSVSNDTLNIITRHNLGEKTDVLRLGYWDSITKDCMLLQLEKHNSERTKFILLEYKSKSYNNIGYIHLMHGDIVLSVNFFSKALKIQEKIKDLKGVALSFNNLGYIYKQQGDITKGLEYYKKSLKIRISLGKKKDIAVALNNIGALYDETGETDKAIRYYEKSLKIHSERNNKKGIALCLNNIGYSLHNNKKNKKEALNYYKRSLSISEELSNNNGLLMTLNNMGKLYSEIGKLDKAKTYALRNLKLAQELEYPDDIRVASQLLSMIYEKDNEGILALKMYKLYIEMRDSISNLSTQNATAKQLAKYEYEKVKQKDDAFRDKKIALEERAKEKQKFAIYFIVIGLLIVTSLLLFILKRFKISKKQNIIIERQKKIVEESLELEKELGLLKSSFVSTASHQFRTPLSIIQSNAELLKMLSENLALENRKRFEKSTDRITAEIAKMTELMDDVLVLGKLTSGNVNFKPVFFDLVIFCSQLTEQFNEVQNDGRTISFIAEGDQYEVYLDIKLLTNSLSNIISNALKYSVGKKDPKLTLSFNPKGFSIMVKDYGIGIPKTEFVNLFQPFFRAENVSEIKGTGLGLSIAKEYIEINKGTVEVKTIIGEGSSFKIKFNR